jgi:hypothetical protein
MNNRKCDNCNICCIIAEVVGDNFYKKPNIKCEYLNKGCSGCSLFNDIKRPKVCNNFECAWLRGFGDINDRPDKNDIMLSINDVEGQHMIYAIELKKGSYLNSGKNIILDIVKKINLPVIVSDFDSVYPNDKGDYVIIHSSLLNRAKNIIGEHIEQLSDNINSYKLIIK